MISTRIGAVASFHGDPRMPQGYPWNHGDLGVIPEAGGGGDCLARRPVANHEKRGSR
jgi:hypothetical protein